VGRNVVWLWEGCMRSVLCNVEFRYQLSIRSGTKENHGKPWSSWPVAGPSGSKLTTSQQSGVEYASPNITSISVRLIYYKIRTQFVLQMFYIHIIWIRNIPCTTLLEPYGTHRCNPYVTGKTLRLLHKAQPVNAFSGNSRCFLWVVRNTEIHRVGRMQSSGMLKRVVQCPLGFKRLTFLRVILGRWRQMRLLVKFSTQLKIR
jgi:hypothetical protein